MEVGDSFSWIITKKMPADRLYGDHVLTDLLCKCKFAHFIYSRQATIRKPSFIDRYRSSPDFFDICKKLRHIFNLKLDAPKKWLAAKLQSWPWLTRVPPIEAKLPATFSSASLFAPSHSSWHHTTTRGPRT
jgi:hypothetical protein